ncbi:hypothetical protein [Neorhizobium sp. DT-125]|uniref:hypothetical protein n=1 Tax=Neorhizobium sp. DT-125 TaxID=3396163 RepID=UPI003F1ADB1C
MLACDKLVIKKSGSVTSQPIGCISVIVIADMISNEDVDFVIAKSARENCSFIMIWPEIETDLEEIIDGKLESDNMIQVATTMHLNESVSDVANFVKYATLVDQDSFYCLIFSQKDSPRARKLIEEISST